MSERADLFCGCAFVKVNDEGWWHVVACPDHELTIGALPEPKVKP